MPLSPEARAELERRGPGNIRRMLQGGGAVGVGPGAFVPILLHGDNPRRIEVDEWLAEQEREERHAAQRRDHDAATRHGQLLFWTRIAGVAAVVGAVAAVVGIILSLH